MEEIETPSIKPAVDAWLDAVTLELKETLGPLAEQHGSKTVRDIFDAYYRFGNMVDYKGYMAAVANRSAMVRQWSVFLEEWPLVLSPFFMRPMYDYDHDETYEGARDLFDAMMYSYSINYLGLPAGNIPIGLVAGRPCGVQIIGQRFREDMILTLCRWSRTRSASWPTNCGSGCRPESKGARQMASPLLRLS